MLNILCVYNQSFNITNHMPDFYLIYLLHEKIFIMRIKIQDQEYENYFRIIKLIPTVQLIPARVLLFQN